MRSRIAIVLVVGAFAVGAFIIASVVSNGGHNHGDIVGGSTLDHETAPKSNLTRAARISVDPLKDGEHWISLTMPGGAYTPEATNGGTDDYRCILFDPHLTQDTFISSVALQPGIAGEVHHAILYRVDPDQVASAEQMDASDPRLGWSCFGGPGLPTKSNNPLASLASAGWLAAFATSGGEQHFAPGTGQLMKAGSELVLQIHYNLLNGTLPDDSSVLMRAEPAGTELKPLQTYLEPAPVEVPCAAGQTGPLCNRTAALADVMKRFGYSAGTTVAGLQLLCGAPGTNPAAPPASDTSTCTRYVDKPMVLQSVAGHMHMLGKSIRVQLIRADGSTQTLFNRPVWNFDDQHADVLPHPVKVGPGDKLKITCTWDPTLRDKLPSLQGLPERYIVWGEGSSDEMCLGIFTYTND